MYNKPIVPEHFDVPGCLETDRMRLRPLMMSDAEKDYDAVISSENRLRTVFREAGDWPRGLTLEQNRVELGWHQTEFDMKTSFAYTVLSLDESQVLGCLYIYPTNRGGHDVEISMWVRQSEADTGLDAHLYQTVTRWINEKWPFRNPAYPGRVIDWRAWEALDRD